MSPKERKIAEAYISENRKLKGFIRKRVRTDEDAEDILHDVFMSMTDGFDDILNISSAISWLYSVARHKIIDFNRKKKTTLLDDFKVGASNDEEIMLLSDIIPDMEGLPDDQMMQELIWDEIQENLELLPENQRQVFLLHELEGYSFNQISELTGASVNTLLSRKRYAILFLREQLQELFDNIKN